MTTTDPQTTNTALDAEAHDAILKAIKKGADRYDPSVHTSEWMRNIAEAYAFATGTAEPGVRPKVVGRR